MFDYILSIFSINCTQPPLIEVLYDELKAYGDSTGKPDKWSLNRIRELEPLAAEQIKSMLLSIQKKPGLIPPKPGKVMPNPSFSSKNAL